MNTSPDAPRAPGPQGLFKQGIDFRRDGPSTVCQLHAEHGDVVSVRLGKHECVLLGKPEHVSHVFISSARKYQKSTGSKKVRSFLGTGLLTADGQQWRSHRRVVQQGFSSTPLPTLTPTMIDVIEGRLARWKGMVGERGVERMDLLNEMRALTLGVASSTLFSINVESELGPLHESFSYAFAHTVRRLQSFFDLPPERIPTPRNLRFNRALRHIDSVVEDIVSRRRELDEVGEDLLAYMMSSDSDTGRPRLDDKELRDEVVTLLLGGYDTTANGLSWAWKLLSQNPDVREELYAEVDAVLGHRRIRPEDLPALPYTRAVFQEALRLYPPIWLLARNCIEQDEIDGYVIPKDTMVLISPWYIHRRPGTWVDPERFDPTRFMAGRRPERFSYFPFGAGQRQCLGTAFAIQEGTLALAMTCQGYRVEVREPESVGYLASMSLSPVNYSARVRARERTRARTREGPGSSEPAVTARRAP